jgi:predicted permease
VTLAVGIGANTTIFTLVNAALLRPPPHVAVPDRLVSLYTSDYSGPVYGTSSLPDFDEFRKQTDVFDGVMAFMPRAVGVGVGDALEGAGLEVVSENYFDVLGMRPAEGRFFTAGEGRKGAAPVAVISQTFFERRFGGNRDLINSPIVLNGRTFTLVGIAPRGFNGAMRPLVQDVWIPLYAADGIGADADDLDNRGSRGSNVVARLKAGVRIEQAQARMTVLAGQLKASYPQAWTDVATQGRRITLVSERESRLPPNVRGTALGFVALLMATVGLVLLVCCANVASLVLARSAARAKEIGVRLSLGATRRRIVRQLLTESTLIALLGGAFGVVLSVWATNAILRLLPSGPVRFGLDLSLDTGVVMATILVSLLTGILFGLAPAMRVTRPDIVSVLKTDRGTIALGGRRLTLQNVLVVSQITMSVLLLVAAGLFVRALANAASINPGFRVDHMLVAEAEQRPGVTTGLAVEDVMAQVQERVAAIPGVRAASWSGEIPLSAGQSRRSVQVEGYAPQRGEDMEFHFYTVGPGFFETMEIPLVRGRGFTKADRRGAAGVAVVNEAFARRFWPGADPIGKRISTRGAEGPFLEIVGVSRDGHYLSLSESARPTMFFPALQSWSGTRMLIRTDGEPTAVLPAVRRELIAVAPTWSVSRTRSLQQHVNDSMLPQRLAGMVLSIFGGVTLLLVAIGVYGVVAYSVVTRTREIGLRIALGATPSHASWIVVRQGLALVGIGVAIALPVAWAVMRLLSGFLMGTSATDPGAFAAAVVILGVMALSATYLPARRASRVDPMVALRAE